MWAGVSTVLGPPKGMDETQVSRLPVFSNGVDCVSCWQLSPEELDEVKRTGRVFLLVTGMGGTMPPVYVGGEDAVRGLCADNGVWPKVPT